MTRDHDRLIDALLRELYRDQPVHDMTAAVLAQAHRRRAQRLRYRIGGGAAALAACILLGLSVWAYTTASTPAEYPTPTLTQGALDRDLQRDTPLTVTTPARIALGGYSTVDLDADTRFTLTGGPRDEVIALDAGRLVADITPRRHPNQLFTVRTPHGEARVTGTKLEVQVLDNPTIPEGEHTMIGNQMILRVLVGTVVLAGSFGEIEVQADERVRSGSVVGRVVEVGDQAFWIYSEKHDEEARFVPRWIGGNPSDGGGLDKAMLEQIRGLRRGMIVRVKWVYDERPRAVGIEVLERPREEAREREADVRRKGDGERAERERDGERAEREREGDRERAERREQEERAIQERRQREQRQRIEGREGDGGEDREHTEREDEGGGDREHDGEREHAEREREDDRDHAQREGGDGERRAEGDGGHQWPQQGTFTGEVIAKTANSITVRDGKTGKALKMIPHWRGGMPADGGGFDKAMLRAIDGIRVGSVVRVEHEFVEHHRLVAIRVLEAPAPPRREDERERAERERDGDREHAEREGDRESAEREGGSIFDDL